ncbi:MAG: type II secretion system protein GspG [Candidatus Omnitrophica bacterium]|nr:type II secretion system protein GspG [Candidatus Omnitrophota bacterium]
MKKSFTLIELIVVIAIIAILAAIIAPNAFRAIEKAKITKTIADLKAIKTAIGAMYADTGKFPSGCIAFTVNDPEVNLDTAQAGLVSEPPVGIFTGATGGTCEWTQANVNSWDGPYLESGQVKDVWHSAYHYDPDYYYCINGYLSPAGDGPITNCGDAPVAQTCLEVCGGAFNCGFPVIQSFGPDKSGYGCDDIIVKMTLN